ncbi:ATP-binding cassette domain-containing protein, partial [Candidatus Pyrohabitans sp.]
GEIFGFLGPNGAGKTTTINMLTTLLLPTSGEAYISGLDVVREASQVRRRIGLVPQEVVLEGDLTARENLLFHGMLYGMRRHEVEARIPELLELVGLRERADSRVKTFSGGMKRRLELVKVLVHEPEVIFLDEPTIGLDPQTRRKIWEYIQTLNRDKGVTIFLTTHYMEEADYLCDRICIIDHGKILDIDSPQKLKDKIGEGDIIEIEVSGAEEKFAKTLEKECGCQIKKMEGNRITVSAKRGEYALKEIFLLADKLGVKVASISVREPTLEDVFIHYTGRGIREELGSGSGMMKYLARRLKH